MMGRAALTEQESTMSKISTFAEIREMSTDTVIEVVKGKVATVYARKTGDGENGPWSFENLELTNPAGEKMRVVLKNRDPFDKTMKGRTIAIMAFHGDRGWSGVYAADNDYKGKVTREIKVTGTAEIAVMDGVQNPSEQVADNRQANPEPSRAPQAQFSPAAAGATKSAKIFIAKRISGMKICLKSACLIRDEFEALTSEKMSEGQLQAITSTLFITGDRSGIFDQLPNDLDYGTLEARVKQPDKPNPPPPPPPEELPEPEDVPFNMLDAIPA